MTKLQTLEEIGNAREKLYSELEAGKITETRATTQERVLRGQSDLKATVPLRLLNIIAKTRNPGVAKYSEPLMRALLKFTTGAEPATLEAPPEK